MAADGICLAEHQRPDVSNESPLAFGAPRRRANLDADAIHGFAADRARLRSTAFSARHSARALADRHRADFHCGQFWLLRLGMARARNLRHAAAARSKPACDWFALWRRILAIRHAASGLRHVPLPGQVAAAGFAGVEPAGGRWI